MACVRGVRGGQVAIYDALLFLMVIILVSVGTFLYSAKVMDEGAGFTDATYRLLAKDQVVATMGLDVDPSGLYVLVSNGTASTRVPLTDSTFKGDHTLEWALESLSELIVIARAENANVDLRDIEPKLNAVFVRTALNGTAFAWEVKLDGKAVMFGGSDANITGHSDLPPNRWSAGWDFSGMAHIEQGDYNVTYATELAYYLWPA
jgi:hypothetical protein